MKRSTRRRMVLATTGMAACAGVLAIVGTLRPGAVCIERTGVGVAGTTMELAWGSEAITKRGVAWHMPPSDGGAMVLGPSSRWYPTTSEASIMTRRGGAAPVTTELHILFVPLLPWAVLFGGAGALLWWRTPRIYPAGACQACGYDLAGLGGARCPECGGPVRSILRRLASFWPRRPECAMAHSGGEIW